MALFQRRPQQGEAVSLYTFGLNKTLIIVGLGNIGKQYEGTRHNIGFDCIDEFASKYDFPNWIDKKDLHCLITTQTISESRVILVKPTTMMNLSGQAIRAIVQFYKVSADQMLVVHDELDIPFGQIRTRVGGADAGHNGVKSIIQLLNENFGRVRVGIGPKHPEQIDSADFVLQKFSKTEQDKLPALTREASAILSEWAYGGGQPIPHETRSFLI